MNGLPIFSSKYKDITVLCQYIVAKAMFQEIH